MGKCFTTFKAGTSRVLNKYCILTTGANLELKWTKASNWSLNVFHSMYFPQKFGNFNGGNFKSIDDFMGAFKKGCFDELIISKACSIALPIIRISSSNFSWILSAKYG